MPLYFKKLTSNITEKTFSSESPGVPEWYTIIARIRIHRGEENTLVPLHSHVVCVRSGCPHLRDSGMWGSEQPITEGKQGKAAEGCGDDGADEGRGVLPGRRLCKPLLALQKHL